MGKYSRDRALHFTRDRQGAVAVIITIALSVIAGMAALAIDMNYLYIMRNRLQTATDAGVLAAAVMLPDQAKAKAAATEYVSKNMPTVGFGTVLDITDDINFGYWNSTTKTFTPGIWNAGTNVFDPPPGLTINAASAVGRRSAQNANAVQSMLAGALGFDTFNIATGAVATTSQGAKWNIILVEDVTNSFSDEIADAVVALKALLDCMHDTMTQSSKIGLVAFTGFGKKYPVTVSGVPVDMPTIGDGYAPIKAEAAKFKVCGSTGMPVCSGTNIGAGLDLANQMFAGTTFPADSKKAIILISDGLPSASSSAKVCPPPNGKSNCSDAQLKTWATTTADAANAANISVFPVFFNRAGADPAGAAFLKTLVRGEGIYSETADPKKLKDLTTAVCTSLQIGRLVD